MSGFEFSSEKDSDFQRSMAGLLKSNNGFFKSAKQASFMLSKKTLDFGVWSDPTETAADEVADKAKRAMQFFGVEFCPDSEYLVFVSAHVRWVDYGSKSWRQVTWVYVLDTNGIVRQYKLKYVYEGRSSSPNPAATVKLFDRGCLSRLSFVEAEVKVEVEKPVSNYIGTVGKREEFVLTVKMVREFQGQSFSYYDSGLRTMTVMESDAGDRVVYWNHVGEKGDRVRIKATVKAQEEYKGVKQTVLSRAKVLQNYTAELVVS